jgi:ABC-type multidrug transport system ATPase subunit
MLWETLTGREHLQFYGRLKGLSGSSLDLAVDESLRSVNLLHGGVPDKQVKKYSGGMRRRLSVAISLIGDAKVFLSAESNISLGPQVVTAC